VGTIGQRYELIRPLAEGGMAGLWLAKLTGSAGFAKLVVMKRILPHLARADRFASMFLDEGRVAADLRHPNIVRVLEAGSDRGELFIAMELLEGMDAGRLMSRTLARGERLPLGVAVQIVVDAAAGRAYAHQKRSLDGEPLDIVHRDISPQNLFVTVDGHTKVVDFGIAKARSQTTMTEVGTLKGKCAYMAPEQLCGDPVDHRADQFALGVVMWELLAGQRLFRRETDVDTLRAVLRHEIPPLRDVVDGVPPALEEVVGRTLALEPAERFPGATRSSTPSTSFSTPPSTAAPSATARAPSLASCARASPTRRPSPRTSRRRRCRSGSSSGPAASRATTAASLRPCSRDRRRRDALVHLRRARDDARARGDARAEASILGHIADVEAARGNAAAARQVRQEAEALV
jgi:serine/threonine protein kinase